MNCTIVTPRVIRWLADGRPARVLNRFDQVCNLADSSDSVISLVSTGIGPGPFSMVLDGDFMKDIDAHSAVSADPSTQALKVGPLAIATDQAALWNPIPDWRRLNVFAQPYLADPLLPAETIKTPLSQLIHGITTNSAGDCRIGAGRLAGLGSGLTPAGDDVLMGVLHAMWVWRPNRDMMRLIVETAVPRTTTLSAAFLTAAMDGEATIQWHDLADGRPGAVDHILAIGASSGRDAWAGFTSAGRQLAV